MEQAAVPPSIRKIYDAYLAETSRLTRDRKTTDGLLGFGRGPDADICHDVFSESLERELDRLADETPSSSDTAALLRYMYQLPIAYKDDTLSFWMLVAVQTFTGRLIGFLSPEDAATLSALYKELYPKSTRLPVQKKIAAQLQDQSGGDAGKPRFSFGLFRKRPDQ